jgi:hypothetical protein
MRRLPAAIAAVWIAAAEILVAQESAPPRTVTPTVPPAQVAAAVAEALREAEAAQARRAKRSPAAPAPARTIEITPSGPRRRYEVRWPTQRMVVHWPEAASDRVTLTWPEGF